MEKLDKRTLIESWARNQGYTGVDELIDSGPRWPHYRAIERHIHIVFQCVDCKREILDEYVRQDPDFLAFWKCCHWCGSPVIAARVIPFAVYFRFHRCVIGQPRGCWQCGHAGQLTPFTCQNGETIQLCHTHRLAYARHIVRMASQEEEKNAAIRDIQAELATSR